MFQKYFLSNFHLKKFKKDNEHIIREYAIQDYVKNTPLVELYPSLIEMIYENNYKRKLKIHTLFPKEKLLEIMRPYLLLYFKSKYSVSSITKNKCSLMLYTKMKKFILYNPKFGRKLLKNIFNNDDIIIFNERHLSFSQKSVQYITNANETKHTKIQKTFFTSHLSVDIDSDDSQDDNNTIVYHYEPTIQDDGIDSD